MQHVLEKPSPQEGDEAGILRWWHFAWRSFPEWGICLVIAVIALALNIYRLGEPSVWFDEVLSIERARQPLPVLWQIIFSTQPNMALYYIALHFWLSFTHLFGIQSTEFVVRFPSAIFAVLGSVLLFILGTRFLGKSAGLIATILYMLNIEQLTYAQDTRSYSMELLLVSITWYALFAILSGTTRPKRWWVVFSLTSVLAVYTHVFSGLIFCTQALVFVCLLILPTAWRDVARKQFLAAVINTVIIGILLIPIILASTHAGRTDWMPTPQPTDAVHVLLSVGNGDRPYLVLLAFLCLLGVIGGVVAWWPGVAARLPWIDEQKATCLHQLFPATFAIVCWCVVPFVLSYVISQGKTHLFSARYLIVLVPPLILLAGLSFQVLAILGWRRIQIGLALLSIIIASLLVPTYYQTAEVENWRDAASWVQQQYQAGDGMICYDIDEGCEVALEYYFRTYPRNGVTFPTDSPGAFPWVHYDLTNDPGDPNVATDPKVIAAYGAKHTRIFYIVARLDTDGKVQEMQNAQHWLDSHYHFMKQVETDTVTIRLYDTGAK